MRERRQRRGFERVDPTLPERIDGDQANAGEGLQVLGSLGLANASQFGQFTDRPGPLGEQFDEKNKKWLSAMPLVWSEAAYVRNALALYE